MVQPQKASPELRDARILVIDDEAQNVRSLTRLLTWAGYTTIRGVTESADAVRTFVEWEPDLLLLDLRMPGMDGFEVMEALSPLVPDGEYLPILVLTGDLDDTSRNRALTAGARDFLTKPFETTEVLLRIENLLETRHLHQRLRRQNVHLEHKVQERTRELADAQVEILYRLALAAEYRDDVTGQHAERVGVLSGMIAGVMDFAENDVDLIRRAAPLHDVGKIGVPDAILMKPGRLTEDELEVIRSHVDIGAQILSG
ncbi:MAG: response regulator, partial [Gemmatimonadota bacterium]|nr:response regulator [Gemmatimonadota bacterium]